MLENCLFTIQSPNKCMVGVFSSAFSQLLLSQLCIKRYEIELWQTWQPNCVTLCTLRAVNWLNSEKQLHGVYHYQFDYTTISKLPICLRCVIALREWTRLAWCFGFVLTRSCLGFVILAIFFWLLLPHSSLTSSLILLYSSILLPHLSLIPLTLSLFFSVLSHISLTSISLLSNFSLTSLSLLPHFSPLSVLSLYFCFSTTSPSLFTRRLEQGSILSTSFSFNRISEALFLYLFLFLLALNCTAF